jgi:hypothetical protein
MVVEGTVIRDFTLNRTVSDTGKTGRAGAVTVRGDRDIQAISRQTMTVKEIKEVPASFGDSITALSSLPGINRAGSFFGPLIIRGADEATNGYYIDGVPMFKVMHFGGIHSVIANDLMNSIDVYSSAFPAQFAGPQGAVININTVDEVKKEGGFADVGFISANALVQMPITRTAYLDGKEIKENRGYVMASGRYGYMSLFIPAFYEYVMNQDLSWLPKYWDYQFKVRYDFNEQNSLTLLAFGSKDSIDLVLKDSWIDPSDDPLWAGMEMYTNEQAHSQALTYKWHYSSRLHNSLMAFASLSQSNQWYSVPESSVASLQSLGIKSSPNIYGLKDDLFMEWWKDHCTLRSGFEARYYNFSTDGNTILPLKDDIDLNDPASFAIVPLGKTYRNRTISGYAENRFVFGGLIFVPGVAAEYLERNSQGYVDPRGMISYTFNTGTTIGAAGGYYSTFVQTMPVYFASYPNVAALDFCPQKSIHRSLSIEQKVDVYTFKVEGFYNNFWQLVAVDSDSSGNQCFTNHAKMESAGVELLAKISDEKDQGLFGWMSYTYNKARYITHQSAAYTNYGEDWVTSPYDMTHVVKLVAGYTFGKNTLSCKFQYNTATPYTPITGANKDTIYADPSDPLHERWVPFYGKPYTERLTPDYRLDVRYSRKLNYRWGYISWYIELIGIFHSVSEQYKWDYRYEYSSDNPKVVEEKGLSFIPNFGVEVKF